MNTAILKPIVPSITSDNATDQKLLDQCSPAAKERRSIEIQVTRNLMALLRSEGYDLLADNGEDRAYSGQDTDNEMITCLFACDEAYLYAVKDSKRHAIFLVMGNDGWDLICDYATGLDPLLEEFGRWINEQMEAATK